MTQSPGIANYFNGDSITEITDDERLRESPRSRFYYAKRRPRSRHFSAGSLQVYRREYTGIANARKHIADYIKIHNTRRPHSPLNDRTPARVHAEIQVHNAA
jgi:transposase InsO family protein